MFPPKGKSGLSEKASNMHRLETSVSKRRDWVRGNVETTAVSLAPARCPR